MKQTILNIAIPLSDIINCSMNTGVFPDALKIAKVVPIFKGGEKDSIGNYRPISILPSFSKVFEKVIFNRLSEYVFSKKILNTCQYGFRKNHSTYMSVLDMYEKISSAIDNNEYAVGIFIDLAKAFDTIDHSILISKMQHYGIRGVAISWIRSYLSNRKQYVLLNETSSYIEQITCGIPQGSILGPLLFVLYINDIVNCSVVFKFVLFADDTNLFHSGRNPQDLSNDINSELTKLSVWFRANKLSLNIKKTNYILFGGKRRKLSNVICLKIDENLILETHSTKFLGVHLDSDLSWKTHVGHIKTKIAKGLGIMNKVRTLLPLKAMKVLYHTLVYPYLQYCNIVWGIAKDTIIEKLFILQKRAIRLCTNSCSRTHTDPLFFKLGLLKLSDINKYQTLIFMFKYKHSILPPSCMSFVTVSNSNRAYSTRNTSYFVRSNCRTDVRKRSLAIRGPILWDALPKDAQDCVSLVKFEKTIKNLYLQNYLP